ncbi:rRNA pseudouridine synthase [Solimicrobium silvestre]|uniref:Dual-specificity RNA pseudouridine synthase RluF n=1 Tax=Solimicrobium silvestre TaxID=2099400 RepID=A0A2S9GT68_9BURK|nr:rRNA pseudouridine synthase [Solimicrobium silvestre]PRC90903.1 16S rRNA uridine pseudouridylate synthase and related pseudouridylate synthase [Solimicrobium silvestre]
MSNSIRLAKRLAEQIPCSRQAAEQYIAGGWVTVDGLVIEEPGFRVLEQQLVELMPKASLATLADVTILWHKPAGVVTETLVQQLSLETMAAGDRSGHRFLKRHTTNLTLTNALETEASGLVVFSQDWNVNRKLVDDASKLEQEFLVEVSGDIANGGLALLNHGLSFNGRALAPIKVSWQNETRLRFAVKGVQMHQITHMCQQVGLTVVSLKRLRIGRIPLSSLPVGQWRYLLGYERF